jgi:hypothetical protein
MSDSAFFLISNDNREGSGHRFEYLKGRQDEIIVKELSIVAKDVIQTFHFQSPYEIQPHGSETNGLNCDDGHIL